VPAYTLVCPCRNEIHYHFSPFRSRSSQSSKTKSSSIIKKPAAGKKGPPLELTEDQKQEIREAFDLFDTDGSGE
jgi:Ca2+-binding EF-hand superfamily protein